MHHNVRVKDADNCFVNYNPFFFSQKIAEIDKSLKYFFEILRIHG